MNISSATIDQLRLIIDQIDSELAKDQEDRVSFQIYSNRVPSLKSNLATYKSLFRAAEWNGKFWMIKKKTKEGETFLDIQFSPSARMNFTIKQTEKPDEDNTELYNIVADASGPNPGDGPAHEMNDRQISQMLLLDAPQSAQFLISCLSPETQTFLQDMKSAEASALINLIQRSGYKISVVMNTRLRIFK
jgi:hypothetical protein